MQLRVLLEAVFVCTKLFYKKIPKKNMLNIIGSSLFNGGFIFEMLLLLCKLVRQLNVKLQNANWGARYVRALQKGAVETLLKEQNL